MKRFAAIATLIFASFLSAQQTAPKQYVIKAARMFDSNAGVIVSNAVVIVAGNEIVAAGPNVTIPQGAQMIDLGDATILPGFIDAHVHLTEESSENWYRDFQQRVLRLPAEQAHYAAMYARRVLEAGFTTVRNVGAHDYQDIGLRNAINAGVAIGPRMLVSGYAIGATGGHTDDYPFPADRVAPGGPRLGVCNGPDECRAAVRYQIKYGADLIKFMPSGGVLSLSDPVDAPELSQGEMNAIVEEAHNWGRKVAAHCHGDIAGKMAVNAGVDSIEHGSFLTPATLTLMKEKGVYLVPTLLAGEYTGGKLDRFPAVIQVKAKAAFGARAEMFRNAMKIGVKIAFGTDSAVSPHGINAQEFGLMTQLGMSPVNALRAGTTVAAALLGMTDRVGSLEKGKFADIVAVPGNPLTDIHQTEHVIFVMKDGAVIKKP
ncbi:MAG TPA: amidohydrolase family protein [Thermoanaerobaculia bacterium]|nr:amidohydrolase family protein [Thermoanaerobaculia bacterium]